MFLLLSFEYKREGPGCAPSRRNSPVGPWQTHAGDATEAAEEVAHVNRPIPAPLRKTNKNWASSVLALDRRSV